MNDPSVKGSSQSYNSPYVPKSEPGAVGGAQDVPISTPNSESGAQQVGANADKFASQVRDYSLLKAGPERDSVQSPTLHDGLAVKAGGAGRADVEKMMKNIDADGDGQISKKELDAFAKLGREKGFADKDSLQLFRAGLDAAALAEIKSREPGQQFSPGYIEKEMKPFLERAYGKNGTLAAEMISKQATGELTPEAAKNWGREARFDSSQRKAGEQILGKDAILIDGNKNGYIDEEDKTLEPREGGGYDLKPIGHEKADQINERIGIARGADVLAKGPYFPNSPDNPPWATRDSNGDPRPEWMGGKADGPWEMERIPKPRKGFGSMEYKLDTTKMSASEALDDMAKNPKNYCFDCAMAKQVVQYQRARAMLGDEKFNELAKKHGMVIGHSDGAYRSGFLAEMTQPAPGSTTNMPLDDYKIGWQGYAKIASVGNPSDPVLLEQLRKGGWSGEHFTVGVNEKGEKTVYAHPFPPMPLAEFDSKLRDKIVASLHGKVKKEDIHIEYSQPLETDVDYARKNL